MRIELEAALSWDPVCTLSCTCASPSRCCSRRRARKPSTTSSPSSRYPSPRPSSSSARSSWPAASATSTPTSRTLAPPPLTICHPPLAHCLPNFSRESTTNQDEACREGVGAGYGHAGADAGGGDDCGLPVRGGGRRRSGPGWRRIQRWPGRRSLLPSLSRDGSDGARVRAASILRENRRAH